MTCILKLFYDTTVRINVFKYFSFFLNTRDAKWFTVTEARPWTVVGAHRCFFYVYT